jgi:tripartite-type tricarboxylate transporter receptor subunit TctC
VLVASAKVEANTVRELVAYAKANPGKLNYASIGLGTQAHLGMELFKLMTGTEITQVAYRGTAPAMTDIAGGVVDVMFTGPPSAKSMSEGGRLKLLAMAAPQRSPLLPDVPTVAETVPGYAALQWYGMLAPAGTPQPVIEKLHKEFATALRTPEVVERLAQDGAEPVGSTPAEFAALIKSEMEKWAAVARAANIQAE